MTWELTLCHYLRSQDQKIVPEFKQDGKYIEYNVEGMVSIRTLLSKYKVNFTLFIYELYSFVSLFKVYNFIHGNLSIDTIFVNPRDTKYKFFVVDLGNNTNEYQSDWDIICLKKSLRDMYPDCPDKVRIIECQ